MGNLPAKPSPAPLTEKNLPDQTGKTFMITGATSGIGLELAQILYAHNATIYLIARSQQKASEVISKLRSASPKAKGDLHFLQVDFNDLTTIKPAVQDFLARDVRVDVLWNNAGIMIPPKGSKTVQGFEGQMGVNTLAPFLFTKLLMPCLEKSGTRVVWVSSSASTMFSPPGGVPDDVLKSGSLAGNYSQFQRYGISKAGNILHSYELARRSGEKEIVSVAIDPGNIDTNLYKDMPRWQHFLAKSTTLKPAIFGAYTELYAGLSDEVKNEDWVVPWGKVDTPRQDIYEARKSKSDGSISRAAEFWEWSEKQVATYA